MSTNLTLDPDAVKEIIKGAILQAIDEDARERLINGAIEYLLAPPPSTGGSYGRREEAPLTMIFNQAVTKATREIIFESFESDPHIRETIKEAVHPVVMKMCENNYDGLPEKIGEAFADWVRDQSHE